jgi:hypothetical protein
MKNKSIAIIAVLAGSVLSVVAITAPYAYASRGDSSETETEQEQKQSNVGSGKSFNDNCGQDLIDNLAVIGCTTIGVGAAG